MSTIVGKRQVELFTEEEQKLLRPLYYGHKGSCWPPIDGDFGLRSLEAYEHAFVGGVKYYPTKWAWLYQNEAHEVISNMVVYVPHHGWTVVVAHWGVDRGDNYPWFETLQDALGCLRFVNASGVHPPINF